MSSLNPYPRAKKQPAWLFQYRDLKTGKWRQKILYCTAENAKTFQRRFDANFNYFKMHPDELGFGNDNMNIRQAAELFLNNKLSNVSHGSYERYRNTLDHLIAHFGGSHPVRGIDAAAIADFTLYYLQDHNKAGTNTILRHFKVFIRWCHVMDYIPKVPKIQMLKLPSQGVRWLTREEYEKIYNNALPEVKDVMTLCISTGARIREVLNVPWSKISMKERQIILNPELVKGRRQEALYMNDKCIEVLSRIRETQKAGAKSPFPYPYHHIEWRYQKAAETAGIKSTLHDLRRSAGAWLLQHGIPIYQVSKFLRHSSVMVTEKCYADLVKKNYTDLSDKIHTILG